MSITSGGFFPPGNFQTARATALALDSSGNIALAAMNYASGNQASGVLAFHASTSGWIQEAPGSQIFYQPIDIISGYTLDAASGLWAWGGNLLVSGAPNPYTTMVSATSGIYVSTTTNLYTSGNTQVSGVALIDVFDSLASGATPWLLSSGLASKVTFSTATSASLSNTAIPFSAICLAASGGSLIVAGQETLNLGSGAYALAVGVSGSALVAFPGSGTAITWALSGTPAAWSKLATTSGLPNYSSGVSAAWSPAGNSIILSDYGSGNWYAFSYTGGVLASIASGAASGISAGVAITTNSSYAGIPYPASSGVYVLFASGATWAGSGVVQSGAFPNCGAIVALNTNTFGVGSSGQAAELFYTGTAWATGNAVAIGQIPVAATYDSFLGFALWFASNGSSAGTYWNPNGFGLSASGTWTSGSGIPLGAITQRQQAIIATTSGYYLMGLTTLTTMSPIMNFPATGVRALGGVAADYSVPTSTSGGLTFLNFQYPYGIGTVQTGLYGSIVSGGAPLSNITMLGQGRIPSALGYGAAGNLLLATEAGGLGPLSSGSSGLTYLLASGGFTAMVVASGLTWLSNAVPGSLVAVSGL